jgi:hypothetical protein
VKTKISSINESENFADGSVDRWLVDNCFVQESSDKAYYVCGESNMLLYMRVMYSR